MAKCGVVDCRKPVGKKRMSKLVKYLVSKSKQKRKRVLHDLQFKPGIRKKVKQKAHVGFQGRGVVKERPTFPTP